MDFPLNNDLYLPKEVCIEPIYLMTIYNTYIFTYIFDLKIKYR